MPFRLVYTADPRGNKEFYRQLLKKAGQETIKSNKYDCIFLN